MTHHVVVTSRDLELFNLLVRAKWLSTSQIRRRFFPGASLNAVQKRLRRLALGGHLKVGRTGRTSESLFSLTGTSRGLIGFEHQAARLPQQLGHFAFINDLRLWFESVAAGRFLAEWEYRPFSTKGATVPDALVRLEHLDQPLLYAIEVDCSTENVRVLVGKLRGYRSSNQRINGVLIWAPGPRRLRAIAAAVLRSDVGAEIGPVWLADSNELPRTDRCSATFISLDGVASGASPARVSLETLVASPLSLSSHEERLMPVSVDPRVGSGSVSSPISV